jgi:hypothetical protein
MDILGENGHRPDADMSEAFDEPTGGLRDTIRAGEG